MMVTEESPSSGRMNIEPLRCGEAFQFPSEVGEPKSLPLQTAHLEVAHRNSTS